MQDLFSVQWWLSVGIATLIFNAISSYFIIFLGWSFRKLFGTSPAPAKTQRRKLKSAPSRPLSAPVLQGLLAFLVFEVGFGGAILLSIHITEGVAGGMIGGRTVEMLDDMRVLVIACNFLTVLGLVGCISAIRQLFSEKTDA